MAKHMTRRRRWKFDWTPQQAEEIQSLPGEFFDGFTTATRMTRIRWMAVAYMCLGKAQRIDDHEYDFASGPEDTSEADDNENWADELREIASKVLTFFQPGDGKI